LQMPVMLLQVQDHGRPAFSRCILVVPALHQGPRGIELRAICLEIEVLTVSVFCVLLLLLTTLIHYEALRLITAGLPEIVLPGRAKLIVVILGTFLAHALEMLLYAVAFWVLANFLGAGTLGTSSRATFSACLYFSAETYTSLGYGDIVPSGALRLLAGMEALNGLLLIGWSASFTYISMVRLWVDVRNADVEQ
jgi:hypothetical protein